MRVRVRENALAVAASSIALYIVAWLALTDWAWNDYDDEARASVDALVNGHLLLFLKLAPAYGGSLVMRAPFILVPKLWGGGELAIYRAAAVPCLIASGVLGVWVVSRLRAQGASRVTRALALILCTANPITVLALDVGHPEALLGAVLCVAAVLTAMGDRPIWAGVLLGLAVANQEWALVAAGPVLIALPSGRLRAMVAAGATAGVVLAPLLVAGHFVSQVKGAATPNGAIFTPWQVWWFLGAHAHGTMAAVARSTRVGPGWLSVLAKPLIVGITVPLTLVCVWLRRRGVARPPYEALLLLMLVLIIRCVLDPWDNWYYPLPFLIALAVWEVLRFKRPPLLGLSASALLWFLTKYLIPAHGVSRDVQCVVFLSIVLPAIFAIASALYAPGLAERLSWRRARDAEPRPLPASLSTA